MKQSVSLITLGVADYERAKAFYEALGWSVCRDIEETAFFQANGATVTREPAETFYGGYAGVFRDLDGHAWEIAHNPGFGLADDGSVILS